MGSDRFPERPAESHLLKGISYILMAWLFLTLMFAFSRPAVKEVGLPVVLFVQYTVSLLLTLPWMIKHGKTALRTFRFGLILLRTVIALIAFSLVLLAVQKTSLTDVTLLNNTAPIFIPFIIWIWHKKPINHRLWPGIVAGFIGIALILQPGREILNVGALYALSGGVALAFSMVVMRVIMRTEKMHTVLFYFFLIPSVLLCPFGVIFWKASMSWNILLDLVLIGVFNFIAQAGMLVALRYAKPTHLGPFNYVAVIYALLIDWFVWHHIPDWVALLGIVLVCLGGVFTILIAPAETKR